MDEEVIGPVGYYTSARKEVMPPGDGITQPVIHCTVVAVSLQEVIEPFIGLDKSFGSVPFICCEPTALGTCFVGSATVWQAHRDMEDLFLFDHVLQSINQKLIGPGELLSHKHVPDETGNTNSY